METHSRPSEISRHTIDDYKTAARRTFERFQFLYRWSENFWRLGHSFDTALDYFKAVDAQPASGLAKDVLRAFSLTKGHWYDDYGWWGLAALNAVESRIFDAATAAQFAKIAGQCWNFMDTGETGDMDVLCAKLFADQEAAGTQGARLQGAPKVYERAKALSLRYPTQEDPKGLYQQLEPRFPNGVWNVDWRYSEGGVPASANFSCAVRCFCLPYYRYPETWAHDSLGGYQNTVTNALYLSLACRLGKSIQANNEYGFFNRWIADPSLPSGDGIFRSWEKDGEWIGVVRERVPSYAATIKEPVWGYRPNLAWAGDQGLLVSAFADYLVIAPNDQKLRDLLLYRAMALIKATMDYIAESSNGRPGLLRDWFDTGDPGPPGGDTDDYRTGSGVFWRGVQHVFERDADFRKAIANIKGFKDFLVLNADAACARAGQPLPDNIQSADQALIGVTNDLATLVAAIRMSAS